MFGLLRKLHQAEGGGAAIETLVVLPFQIFLTCLIVQTAHYMVARQVVYYAAFAAARAALVADPTLNGSGSNWDRLANAPVTNPSFWDGTDAAWVDEARVWRAAAHVCSLLEIYHNGDLKTWLNMPTRNSFRYDQYGSWEHQYLGIQCRHFDAAADGDVEVSVVYATDMPVPIAGKWFYNSALSNGLASSARPGRMNVSQVVHLAKPWCTQVP